MLLQTSLSLITNEPTRLLLGLNPGPGPHSDGLTTCLALHIEAEGEIVLLKATTLPIFVCTGITGRTGRQQEGMF
jgi:hypothetical protein